MIHLDRHPLPLNFQHRVHQRICVPQNRQQTSPTSTPPPTPTTKHSLIALSEFVFALPYKTGTRKITPCPSPPDPDPDARWYSSSTASSPSSLVCPYKFV